MTLLRFLVGGLATVAGIVLLFVASFGDPAAVMAWAQRTLPFAGAARPADVAALQQPHSAALPAPMTSRTAEPPPPPGDQPQAEAQANVPSQVQARDSVPPASVPPPAVAAADKPAPDAKLQAQRAALQQQLQKLQTETAQAAQSVDALRHQASQERQDLDSLRQERAAQQKELARLHEAQAKEAAVKAEVAQARQPAAAVPAQPAASVAAAQPPAAVAQAQAQPPAASAAPPVAVSPPQPPQSPPATPVQTAEAGNPDLPLPPPAPPAPPPQARNPAPPAAGNAGSRLADQPGNGALRAVMARLRQQHETGGQSSNAGSSNTGSSNPGPSNSGSQHYAGSRPAENVYAQSRSEPAPRPSHAQPDSTGPRQRLGLARAALVAGNLEAARQYLEEAQLQLVFRPITPGDGNTGGSSRVAGDVASALGTLGAGDRNRALDYVDRAMAEVQPSGTPAPVSYGYAGNYGDGRGPQ